MTALIRIILGQLARLTIKKYKPRIIGVTGSVGKTSAKQAIAQVIRTEYSVWENSKNFNNEIGLPLTVLGEKNSGYRNIFLWLRIFTRAVWHLLSRREDYPKYLVLEYGIDHVGDMKYLLTIAQPDMAVITAISPTHLEFMGSVENLQNEEGSLVTTLTPKGTAILNIDNEYVAGLVNKIKANIISYGTKPEASVRAESITQNIAESGAIRGMSFKLLSGGSSVPIVILDVIGKPVILVSLAAAAVGVALKISPIKIAEALKNIPLPPSRMRLLPGVKHTTLLDDTYNSSPDAAKEAIEALAIVPLVEGARRWAILGDMLELGVNSERYHQVVGELVADKKIEHLVTIGVQSRAIAHGALNSGMNSDKIWHFADSSEGGEFIKDQLKPGDVVLIKGSQGVRCEKITKELMAEPEKARDLLCRQYHPWI